MDLRPGRQAIIRALTDAGLEFPESATLKQLKPLYAPLNSGEGWEVNTAASAAGYDSKGTKEGAAMLLCLRPLMCLLVICQLFPRARAQWGRAIESI